MLPCTPPRKVGLAKSGRNQNHLTSARKKDTRWSQRKGNTHGVSCLTCVRKVPERGAERRALQTLTHRTVVVKTGPPQGAVHNVALHAHASPHHASAQQTGPHHTFLLFQLRWKEKTFPLEPRAKSALFAAGGALTFNPVFLHLLHFGDTLPEVADETGAVLLTGGHEDDEDFPLTAQDGRRQTNTMGVVWEVQTQMKLNLYSTNLYSVFR